ncbi:MAG: bifunctional metallophosphatase/5'-nucleotidase [Frankiaceae bacterium]
MTTHVRRVAAAVAVLAIPALAAPVAMQATASAANQTVQVHLLGFNDFHGNITGNGLKYLDPNTGINAAAGGAARFADAINRQRAADGPGKTVLLEAGDMVGASPPESSLLRDRPTLDMLNLLKVDVATMGNHEFDKGVPEIFRQVYGGQSLIDPSITFDPLDFPVVSANIVSTTTGKPIFKPYVIKTVNSAKIAFIGATTTTTPTITTKGSTDGVQFLDIAQAVNSYVPEIESKGVKAIVLIVHEGGVQSPYRTGAISVPIAAITQQLDPQIDMVISGHSHTVINGYVGGRLVVQASSFGRAFEDVTLDYSKATGDIVRATADIVPVWQNDPPLSTNPAPHDPNVQALVDAAVAEVGPGINRVINTVTGDVTRSEDVAGESALGDLIADGQRTTMGTQIALMNEGGIRADMLAGEVTWGDLFSIQPFNNLMVTMKLTGAQLWTVLGQQFQPANGTIRNLQISGLNYNWHQTGDFTGTITGVWLGTGPAGTGTPIANDASTVYTVTTNNFLAGGGDGFAELANGANQVIGPSDLDVLINYVGSLPTPFSQAIAGRIGYV